MTQNVQGSSDQRICCELLFWGYVTTGFNGIVHTYSVVNGEPEGTRNCPRSVFKYNPNTFLNGVNNQRKHVS
jgi:hypothetical protein